MRFHGLWDRSQLYSGYARTIYWLLHSSSDSCNNQDIVLAPGYNYNVLTGINYIVVIYNNILGKECIKRYVYHIAGNFRSFHR